jgi:arabinose-5-phosphate isomerase
LIVRKGFRREDFAFYHPAGALGRQLLLKVEDIMRQDRGFPRVGPETLIKNVLLAITQVRCGSACVVDRSGKLLGIFTDGDLRRHLDKDLQLLTRKVKDVMTRKPTVIQKDKLAVEAFNLLQERKIDELPVVDNKGRAVGLLDIQDLMRAGLF